MSPEQRRDMLVRAVLPLVAEHGTTVTSSQIAKAAGIGEATIFRAFKDKDELLDACITQALRPDDVLDAIAAISLDEPLPARLHEAATALQAHLERMGRVLSSLHATGHASSRTHGGDTEPRSSRSPGGGRHGALAEARDAVAALLAPERESLRLPPTELATAFLSMLFNRSRVVRNDDSAPLRMDALVQLFLHGALSEAATPPSTKEDK
jgi:AcrR family transcriptional regulator